MTAPTSHRAPIYLAFRQAPSIDDEAYGANQRQVPSLLRNSEDGLYPALYAEGLCRRSGHAVAEYNDFLEQLCEHDPARAVQMHRKVIAEMDSQNATPNALRQVAGLLQQKGRNGDTVLAHITPKEAALLEHLGGAGTRNPETGLLEFFPVEVDAHTREGYDVKSHTRSSPGTGGTGTDDAPNEQTSQETPSSYQSPIDKDYRDAIADNESKGQPNSGYGARNSHGYLGRYQMGDVALIDSGMKTRDGQWTGKGGVKNEQDFLNDPQAQERAFADYMAKHETYLTKNGSMESIGKTFPGKLGKGIQITKPGLLAAAHRQGHGNVKKYLDFQIENGWSSDFSKNKFKGKLSDEKKDDLRKIYEQVETRLRLFQDKRYR